MGRPAEAHRGSPVDRLYMGTRRIGTPAEASGRQLRNAREASARDEAFAVPTRRGFPTIAIRWRRASGAGGVKSSKRSSASVGAGAPFRGKGIARPEQLREPKQSWRAHALHAWMWAIGAARDSAVGAVRRQLGTSIDAPRGLLLRSGRSTKAASTRCALVALRREVARCEWTT